MGEDLDGDGRLDVDEDTNGNGELDTEDLDGDGRHEVLFQVNHIVTGQLTRIMGSIHSVVDFPEGERRELLRVDGVSYGTARVVDIDHDGWLEFVFSHALSGRWTVEARALDARVPSLGSWDEYMGPGGQGVFRPERVP